MSLVEKQKGEPFDNGHKVSSGQYERYAVLPESERAKGFVRPLRTSYRHVGLQGPKNPLRDLTEDEKIRYAAYGYVKYEPYPPSDESSVVGNFWTQDRLDKIGKGCGTVTTMGLALSETYARDPSYYGSTFCCGCGTHLPIAEFCWEGTYELVGS